MASRIEQLAAELLALSELGDDGHARIVALLDGTDRELGQAVLTRAAELVRLKMTAETSSSIEELAAELVSLRIPELLAEIDRLIEGVIGGVDPATARQALDRAAEIMATRALAAARTARMMEMISRLAHATAMPDGASPVRWLSELGLVEWDPATGYRLTEQAHPRVVRP